MFRFKLGASFAEPYVSHGRGGNGKSFFRGMPGPMLTLLVFAVGVLILLVALGAFYYISRRGENLPAISIVQPEGFLTLTSGQGIVLVAEGQAKSGVQRIDFLVDGVVVEQRLSDSPGTSSLQASFPWFSSGIGLHELSVVAYDARGRASGQTAVLVRVKVADENLLFPLEEQAGGEEQQPPAGAEHAGQTEGEPAQSAEADHPAAGEGQAGEAPAQGAGAEAPGGENAAGEAPLAGAGQPPGAEGQADGANPPADAQGGQPPAGDQGAPGQNAFVPPPVFGPDGQVGDVIPPRVHLEIEQQPGEPVVLITATADDNVGLRWIELLIRSAEGGQQPIFLSAECMGQPVCEIAPLPYEQALPADEWVFVLDALDTSGNASQPAIDQVEIICNQGDACAMADHQGGFWWNFPPGGFALDPVELVSNAELIVPEAPSELKGMTLSCTNDRCVNVLEWVDNSNSESGFKILRNGRDIATTGAGVWQYLDRPVPRGEQYAYVVRAFNELGESAVSNNVVILAGDRANIASDLTATSFCAVPLGCEVALSWVDNSDDETGFRILRDGEEIAIVEADSTEYGDPDVERGAEYVYQVQVFNESGPSVGSNELVVVVENAPRMPTNLRAFSSCAAPWGCMISIEWDDNSDDEEGFLIFRDGFEFDAQAADVPRYDDHAAEPGRQYAYTVKAYNEFGFSFASNTVWMALNDGSYSIGGHVWSECPSEEDAFGRYYFPFPFNTIPRAGPACSPGSMAAGQAYEAEGATIQLARCEGPFPRIPDGEFAWYGQGDGCRSIVPLSQTTTNGSGEYSFDNLAPGVYVVRPLGFGEAGRFANHTDYALRYFNPVAYVGVRDHNLNVSFGSVIADHWACGYLIEPFGDVTTDEIEDFCNYGTLEIP